MNYVVEITVKNPGMTAEATTINGPFPGYEHARRWAEPLAHMWKSFAIRPLHRVEG